MDKEIKKTHKKNKYINSKSSNSIIIYLYIKNVKVTVLLTFPK